MSRSISRSTRLATDRPERLAHARRSRFPSAGGLSGEVLKAEISKVHKNQLLGSEARKMHVMRGRLRSPSVSVPDTWPGAPSCDSWATWDCAA